MHPNNSIAATQAGGFRASFGRFSRGETASRRVRGTASVDELLITSYQLNGPALRQPGRIDELTDKLA